MWDQSGTMDLSQKGIESTEIIVLVQQKVKTPTEKKSR